MPRPRSTSITTPGTPSVYNVLVDDLPLADIVRPVEGIPQLLCAPATIDLAGAEIELVPLVARESRLSRALGGYTPRISTTSSSTARRRSAC